MIKVELKKGFFVPENQQVRVRHNHGQVLLIVDEKQISLRTPASLKLGLSLVKKSDEATHMDFVNLIINGEEIHLLPSHAKQIGGAILRKTDQADDYQLAKGA